MLEISAAELLVPVEYPVVDSPWRSIEGYADFIPGALVILYLHSAQLRQAIYSLMWLLPPLYRTSGLTELFIPLPKEP